MECVNCGVLYEPRKHNAGKYCSQLCYNEYRIKNKVRSTSQFSKGDNVGKKNVMWVGHKAKYGTVHDYISYHYGQPQICEHCDSVNLGSRKHQWANISGEYRRDRSDWLRLCAKCHFVYDKRYLTLSKYQKAKIKYGRPNKTGFKNVRLTKQNKYQSYLKVDGKTKYLGSYKTPQEAHQVYKKKALELYGTY